MSVSVVEPRRSRSAHCTVPVLGPENDSTAAVAAADHRENTGTALRGGDNKLVVSQSINPGQ